MYIWDTRVIYILLNLQNCGLFKLFSQNIERLKCIKAVIKFQQYASFSARSYAPKSILQRSCLLLKFEELLQLPLMNLKPECMHGGNYY